MRAGFTWPLFSIYAREKLLVGPSYEAIVVKCNAPRWARKLEKYGYINPDVKERIEAGKTIGARLKAKGYKR